ncbi:MAG: hypothetical protein EBU08_12565 [Micrococcales bacterium]|nr:hypothetical protein [Micrococcales bacterium]
MNNLYNHKNFASGIKQVVMFFVEVIHFGNLPASILQQRVIAIVQRWNGTNVPVRPTFAMKAYTWCMLDPIEQDLLKHSRQLR